MKDSVKKKPRKRAYANSMKLANEVSRIAKEEGIIIAPDTTKEIINILERVRLGKWLAGQSVAHYMDNNLLYEDSIYIGRAGRPNDVPKPYFMIRSKLGDQLKRELARAIVTDEGVQKQFEERTNSLTQEELQFFKRRYNIRIKKDNPTKKAR